MFYWSNILNRKSFSDEWSQYLTWNFGIENQNFAIFDPCCATSCKFDQKINNVLVLWFFWTCIEICKNQSQVRGASEASCLDPEIGFCKFLCMSKKIKAQSLYEFVNQLSRDHKIHFKTSIYQNLCNYFTLKRHNLP